ncbi:MAG TPA: hypothetical protein VEM96_03350 [Pyrinomonadaceae bacterium]|nr:hypothetical protein [Pyrinomonadaceae bacterium]
MKSLALIPGALLLILMGYAAAAAQNAERVRISRIVPYDKGVPGQILEFQVEGLAGGANTTMLPLEDFQIEVTQDGIKQTIRARVVSPTITRETNPDGTVGEVKRLQNVGFVVPQGLHPGEVEVRLSYHDQHSDPVRLTIVERPLRPVVASVPIITITPANVPAAPRPGTRVSDLGWRFERDSKTELHVSPLVDPDDPNSAVLIRFKQGDAWFEGDARVVHRPRTTEQLDRGVRFLPARDVLELNVPAGLSMGPAEIEIKERANGQESDPVVLKVQIVDSTRSAEAPAENAPRLLSVTPQRIGAGQTLMLAVDYLRTLNPDPAQTLIMIEQGTARYVVKPDTNSATQMPNWTPDSPVLLMAHATRQIIGPAQIRIFNSLRGEQGGLSAPKSIEIVDEVLPPEVTSVAESTDADLAQLRQMYEIQHQADRPFPEYDPKRVYFTIRGGGFDPNPRLVRVTLEQNGRRAVLTYADFSFYGGSFLILRVPQGFTAGRLIVSIEHRGLDSFSAPVIRNFNLSKSS